MVDKRNKEPSDEKAERDAALDEALEETFPTSDAIQLSAHPEATPAAPSSSDQTD